MKVGDRVILRSFNGKLVTPRGTSKNENYWLLITFKGTIVLTPHETKHFIDKERLLVQFDENVSELGLACHNEVENSLWILESDLELINS